MANLILGIDVGPEYSALAQLDGKDVASHTWQLNGDIRIALGREALLGGVFVLESPQAQNRPLGKLLRDTIFWAGRFAEIVESKGWRLIEAEERDVCLELTGRRDSNNAAILQALKDHFGDKRQVPCGCGTGLVEGKREGTTKKCPACRGERFVTEPGPLAGLNEHERSALACALWYQRRFTERGGA